MEDNSRIISGNIFTNMLIFTFPIIMTGILQLLYNAADVIVVGRYAGSNSLAAVGSTGSLVNLFTNLFVGLSSGTSVCVAQFTGAKNSEAIKKSVHTSIGISLIGGLFLTFIGLIFSKGMLEFMSTPDDILNEAALYMRIIFLGMPASMLFNFGAAILRAAGDIFNFKRTDSVCYKRIRFTGGSRKLCCRKLRGIYIYCNEFFPSFHTHLCRSECGCKKNRTSEKNNPYRLCSGNNGRSYSRIYMPYIRCAAFKSLYPRRQ